MEVSLFPAWAGNKQPRLAHLERNTLRLSTEGPVQSGGQKVMMFLVWQRAPLTTDGSRHPSRRKAIWNMATENALIDGALRNWHSNMDRVGRFFRSLSDDDLQKEIAPGKNRLIYIWGHLSATNDRMIPLLGFGERRYPELDLIFISQPDRAVPHNFAGEAMGDMWSQLGDLLWSEFAKLTPAEWLDRHQAVSPEDFEREPHRNRYAILLGRTTHLAYHLGQAILVKR